MHGEIETQALERLREYMDAVKRKILRDLKKLDCTLESNGTNYPSLAFKRKYMRMEMCVRVNSGAIRVEVEYVYFGTKSRGSITRTTDEKTEKVDFDWDSGRWKEDLEEIFKHFLLVHHLGGFDHMFIGSNEER